MLGVKKNESEIGEEQRNNRLKGQANTGEKASRCGFVQEERADEKKYRNKGECGGSNIKERALRSRSALSSVGDWTWIGNYILFHSLCLHLCSRSRTPSSPPAIPSTTRNPTLLHSFLAPSIHPRRSGSLSGRRGQEEGYGGAPSQKANRCSPSGVSQMADIKTSWGSRER